MSDSTRTVIVSGRSTGYANTIEVGPHHLTADEPVDAGGSDTGPRPHELLCAALGSCISITVSMYARHKQWPLESLTVRVRHLKIPAAECTECETKEGMIDRFETDIELRGALDQAQRERLLEIAHRCPVHRTLTSEIDIRARLI